MPAIPPPAAASTDPRALVDAAARLFELAPEHVEVQLSEATTVARVETVSGVYAVKIFPSSSVDRPLTEWRHALAAHAAARGLPVPAPLRTPAGALTACGVVGGTDALVQASAWSTGAPLADHIADARLLHHIGRTAARLVIALHDAPAPPAHDPHAWDLRRSGDTLTEALAHAADPAVRVVGLRALRIFRGVQRLLPDLPQSIVHHDLHDDNLRIGLTPQGPRVVGILDFGDATHGPRVADLVIAAAYATRRLDDPLSGMDDVVSGWTELMPLTTDERAMIAPLAAVRLATNAAVWHARSRGDRAAYARQRAEGSLRAAASLLDAVEARA